tara:strand:+ start:1037 stop:1261 length:225 start_codon:yes stop_codon:yes gene_type:complete
MAFKVYYTHITGDVDLCDTTDLTPEEWVKNNNEERWEDNAGGCGDLESDEHDEKVCICIEDIDDFEFVYTREIE